MPSTIKREATPPTCHLYTPALTNSPPPQADLCFKNDVRGQCITMSTDNKRFSLKNLGGCEIFRICPGRLWGPPSLLYNGYRVFPGGKDQPGRQEREELYLYFPHGPYGLYRASVPVQGCNLPLHFFTYRSLSSSLYSFLHFHVVLPLLCPNILLSTSTTANTLSLRFSLNVRDHFSHPYKTTCKTIFLYILTFYIWKANRKTKYSSPNESKHSLTSICS